MKPSEHEELITAAIRVLSPKDKNKAREDIKGISRIVKNSVTDAYTGKRSDAKKSLIVLKENLQKSIDLIEALTPRAQSTLKYVTINNGDAIDALVKRLTAEDFFAVGVECKAILGGLPLLDDHDKGMGSSSALLHLIKFLANRCDETAQLLESKGGGDHNRQENHRKLLVAWHGFTLCKFHCPEILSQKATSKPRKTPSAQFLELCSYLIVLAGGKNGGECRRAAENVFRLRNNT